MSSFDYNNINLIPKKCIVDSRSQCQTHVQLGNHSFALPIIPANMECVISSSLAESLAKKDYFYIMHRFNIDIKEFIRHMQSIQLFTSISIGVNDDSYELLLELSDQELIPDFITIDIAHGHSIKMQIMLNFIRAQPKLKNCFLICGNVSTPKAVYDLIEWGADCIKVGIGPGSACTTYPTTGFGSRDIQASVIKDCAKMADKYNIPIIADGGIRLPCDIAKSIALGAKMVMIGGMLSGFNESPGKLVELNGKRFREFYGSASSFSIDSTGQPKTKNIEGTKQFVEYKDMSILDYYVYLQQCLQSAISYGGGSTLESLSHVEYVVKSN